MDGSVFVSRRTVVGSLAALGLAAPAILGSSRLARADTVEIGAILPLSGNLRVFGQQARLGLELAVADINHSGGVLGHRIAVDYQDDGGDPQQAVDAAEALVRRDSVLGVTGPITSASRDAIADIMMRSRTPLLYATDYEGGACGEYLFFFNSVPNQSAVPLMRYALDRIADRFFMLGADYVWPHRMFDISAQTVEAAGGQVMDQRFVPLSGLSDYSPLVDDVRRSGAEVLVLALPGSENLTFVDQATQAGLLGHVTICDLGGIATYLHPNRMASEMATYGCVPFVETDAASGVQNFVAGIRRLAGADTVVTSYAMTHYNALNALKLGLEASGEASRDAAAAGMAGLHYQIPTGRSRISPENHHSDLSMFVARTEGGALEVVEALGSLMPDPGCTI